MDDKNVVKKRVTLAIAFAVFIVVVIAVISRSCLRFRRIAQQRCLRKRHGKRKNFLRLSTRKL